jgi:lysophospholipase L1-like esterase
MRLLPFLVLLQSAAVLAQTSSAPLAVENPSIHILGRYQALPNHDIRLGYPGTGLSFRFSGTSLGLTLTANSNSSALTVVIDHGEPAMVLVAKGAQTLKLADNLAAGPHTAEIYKRTETFQGILDFTNLQLAAGGELLSPAPLPVRKLLFVGDSVTCGAHVDDDNPTCTDDPLHPSSDPYHTYGMTLGRRLDAQTDLVCYIGRGLQRTYGGKTATDGLLNVPQFLDLTLAMEGVTKPVLWDANAYQPDGIVVSVGTNDFGLEKTQPLDATSWVADYVKLLRRLRAEYPAATILATEGAMVTDPRLRQYVQQAVADAHDPQIQWAKATHYPGSSCNGHPTAAQHLKMADDMEPQLRNALHW